MALLREPVLYLSLYFKVHRATYYELLNRVRLSGDGETWLGFLADAVLHSAEQASMAAEREHGLAAARRVTMIGARFGLRVGGQRVPRDDMVTLAARTKCARDRPTP